MQRWVQFTNKGGRVIKGEKPEGDVIEAPIQLPHHIPMEHWKLIDGKITEMNSAEKALSAQSIPVQQEFSLPFIPKEEIKPIDLTPLEEKHTELEARLNDKSHNDEESFQTLDEKITAVGIELQNSSEEIDVIYDNQTTLAMRLESVENRIAKYTQESLLLKSELMALEQDLDQLEIDGALKNEDRTKQHDELLEKFKEHQSFVHESILNFSDLNEKDILQLEKETKDALKFVHDTFSVPKIEHIHHINVFKVKEYLKIAITSTLVYELLHLLIK